MSKEKTSLDPERAKVLSIRFILALVLVAAGIGWLVFYYVGVRPDPTVFPPPEATPKAIGDLGRWNYVIGFGLLMLGLIISAHPSTPMGRGRGVVIGMLGCLLIGLLWICVYYVFSNDLSKLWIFNDLGAWNLAVGIAFMGVCFSFATKWE